jgi:UPF0716 protein FxsA
VRISTSQNASGPRAFEAIVSRSNAPRNGPEAFAIVTSSLRSDYRGRTIQLLELPPILSVIRPELVVLIMFKRILALLLLIPLVDAIVLVYLGFQFNPVLIVALVVLTALVGMLFVRAEGRRTIRKIQRSLQRGDVPTNDIMDGGLLIAAGAFLLTPGLVTDLVGFLLVLPPSRIVIRKIVKRFVVTPYLDKKTGGFASGKVYTFGFPQQDDATGGQSGGQANDGAGDVYDLGENAYDVEFDDEDDRSAGQ